MHRLSFPVLAALAISVAPAADAATPPTVTIKMQSRYYAPDPVRLTAGEPVTLRLVNLDGSTHAFGARHFFRSAKLVSGEVTGGKVELAPGETASVTLVPVKGSYKVECSQHQMDKLGRHGRIIVE